MSREQSIKKRRKTKHYQIEIMKAKKVFIDLKTVVKMKHWRLKIWVSKKKRILKSISEDSHKLIKVNRRSTLTDNQLVNVLEMIF